MNSMRCLITSLTALLALLATTSAFGADISVSRNQIDALDKLLEAHSDDFAGLSVDEEAQTIVVRQVRSSDKSALQKVLVKLPKTTRPLNKQELWRIDVQLVSRSQRQLESIFERVSSAEPWAMLLQPVLTGWEIDIEHNVVAVEVTAVTPALLSATNRLFGSAVELRPTVEEKHRYAFSRSNDHASWYSGIPIQGLIPDAVYKDQVGQCTAGFAVSDSVGFFTGLLTAGHCFGEGRSVSQPSDKERVGSIIAGQHYNMSIDYALIGWNPNDQYFGTGFGYGTKVWISENKFVNINDPDGDGEYVAPPKVGTVVCFNGAKTHEQCNAKVTSLNSCYSPDYYITTCNLVRVSSTNGKRIANHGDSGGPVYTKINGTVEPVGIIIGGGNVEGTIAYYHKIDTVLKALEISPNVGGLPFHVIRVGL